jgi:hypothetical protein
VTPPPGWSPTPCPPPTRRCRAGAAPHGDLGSGRRDGRPRPRSPSTLGSTSNLPTGTHRRNAAATRTSTAFCAKTSRKAPTSRHTPPTTSTRSPPNSTTDPANATAATARSKSSTGSCQTQQKPVLQPNLEFTQRSTSFLSALPLGANTLRTCRAVMMATARRLGTSP